MQSKEYLFFVTLIVTLAVNSHAQSHNMTVGTKNTGDVLLLEQLIKEESKFLRKVILKKTFSVSGYISQIVVEDQRTDGKGGYASIIGKLGPRKREVKMKFKSQRGQSINFRLKIYGQ